MVSYTVQLERRRKLNRGKAGKRNKKMRSRRTIKFAVHPEKA